MENVYPTATVESILDIMYEAERVRSNDCDAINAEYSKFCDSLIEGDVVGSFRNCDEKVEICRLDK